MLDIIAAVAEAALAHPQTVERRMLGIPVRGRVGARIDAELAKRGITPGSPQLVTSAQDRAG